MVTPIGPDDAETGRLGPTRDEATKHGVPQTVMLTRVPDPHRGAARDLRRQLVKDGFDVLRVETRQDRRLYADVWGTVPPVQGDYYGAALELDEITAWAGKEAAE
jgi:hypothetical protein